MTDKQPVDSAALETLCQRWLQRARGRIDSAKHEGPEGKRALETTAIVYFNCAQELKALLDLPAGDVADDLAPQVVEQDSEGPRS